MKKTFEPNLHLHGKLVELVACGGAHTVVKTSTQEVYSFGLNNRGQLGLSVDQQCVTFPAKVKSFTSFKIT